MRPVAVRVSEKGDKGDVCFRLQTVMTDWGGAKGATGEEERRCLDLFLIFLLFVYLLKKEKVIKSSHEDDMKEKQQKQESL